MIATDGFPLVSIVIPCYNAAAFVGEAIESALGQSYVHKEVIVIDDGSTDGSLQVIQSFGDAVRWESGPNRGGCAARNRGLDLAKGELIQFLDADDLLHADKLERQVPQALKYAGEVVYCDHDVCQWECPDRLEVRQADHDTEDPVLLVLRHRTMTIAAPLHEASRLRCVGGFRVGLRASQEFDLHLRLAAAGVRFLRMPEVLFTVRRRAGSVSSDTATTLSQVERFLPEIVDSLEQRGELTTERRQAFAEYAGHCGRTCVHGGEVEAGRRLLRFAMQTDSQAVLSRNYGRYSRPLARLLDPVTVESLIGLFRSLRRREF